MSRILDWFEENEEAFNDVIEQVDSWDGYLGDDRYYEMYMLDEFYQGIAPTEILARAFYGHDEDNSWTDERGEKHYGEFNPNREWFRYNGYGNLVSSDYKDYSAQLDEYFVEHVKDVRGHIWLDRWPELEELLDEEDEE